MYAFYKNNSIHTIIIILFLYHEFRQNLCINKRTFHNLKICIVSHTFFWPRAFPLAPPERGRGYVGGFVLS